VGESGACIVGCLLIATAHSVLGSVVEALGDHVVIKIGGEVVRLALALTHALIGTGELRVAAVLVSGGE
jgi:hypothetical protein